MALGDTDLFAPALEDWYIPAGIGDVIHDQSYSGPPYRHTSAGDYHNNGWWLSRRVKAGVLLADFDVSDGTLKTVKGSSGTHGKFAGFLPRVVPRLEDQNLPPNFLTDYDANANVVNYNGTVLGGNSTLFGNPLGFYTRGWAHTNLEYGLGVSQNECIFRAHKPPTVYGYDETLDISEYISYAYSGIPNNADQGQSFRIGRGFLFRVRIARKYISGNQHS